MDDTAMATTTATNHQQRYRDFSFPPEVTKPRDSAPTTSHNIPQNRDYMAQPNNNLYNSSRQTMTTVGSSSRFSSNNNNYNNSGMDPQQQPSNRLLDGSSSNHFTPNTSSKSFRTQEEAERQRRAEENAAFVKMLEEESFLLQGGQLPKKQQRDRNSAADQAYGPNNAYGTNRRELYGEQERPYSHSSSRSGRSSRYSQHNQQPHQPSAAAAPPGQQQGNQYLAHPIYSRYRKQDDEEDDDDIDRNHNRDIPLNLNFPITARGVPRQNSKNSRDSGRSKHSGYVPSSNPLGEPPKEFELGLGFDDGRGTPHSSAHGGMDRYLPSSSQQQRRLPPKTRSNPHDEYPLGQPNMMSLEQAIHKMELEGDHHAQYAHRELPEDYDDILIGRHQPPQRQSNYNHPDNRYHHSSQYPNPQQQQPPPQQQLQQRNVYHGVSSRRLMMPVDFVEFPTDWDGREIEPTEDDELLDRDEDEYYRRRAAYRQQQQQHQQAQRDSMQPKPFSARDQLQSQSFNVGGGGRDPIMQSKPFSARDQLTSQSFNVGGGRGEQHQRARDQLQSHSLQSMSQQSQSRSTQLGASERDGRDRRNVQRNVSSLSRESGAAAPPYQNTDMYSQTMAHNGRRVPMQIEVSPGVSMPFRGSEETWEAIALNRIVKTSCLGCSIKLYCVEDAELVVCPDCQTMSPAHATEDPSANRTGLGLGFKEEQLVQWRTGGL